MKKNCFAIPWKKHKTTERNEVLIFGHSIYNSNWPGNLDNLSRNLWFLLLKGQTICWNQQKENKLFCNCSIFGVVPTFKLDQMIGITLIA